MWYVVWVKTGAELKVLQMCDKLIGNHGARQVLPDAAETDEECPYNILHGDPAIFEECFIPMREVGWRGKDGWTVRKKTLFPGYLFFITDHPLNLYERLRAVPEFTRLLDDEDGRPIELQPQEMDFLRKYTDEERIVRMSTAELIGKELIVTSGPMLNQQGKVVYINRRSRYCILEVPFMGQLTRVRLGLDIVRKADQKEE